MGSVKLERELTPIPRPSASLPSSSLSFSLPPHSTGQSCTPSPLISAHLAITPPRGRDGR